MNIEWLVWYEDGTRPIGKFTLPFPPPIGTYLYMVNMGDNLSLRVERTNFYFNAAGTDEEKVQMYDFCGWGQVVVTDVDPMAWRAKYKSKALNLKSGTARRLLEAIFEPDLEDIESMSIEEVDSALRQAGIDPEEVAERARKTLDEIRAKFDLQAKESGS